MSNNRFARCAAIAFLFVILTGSACVQQKSAASERAAKTVEVKTEPAASIENNRSNAQIAQAQKLIEKAPESSAGYNQLAAGYIQLARETGDFSLNRKAEAAARRALELEPENPIAQKLRVSLLLTMHRFAEARAEGLRMQQSAPRDAFVYGVLTDANIELGNYEEAAAAGQKMVDLKPDAASYARVSQLRSLHGDSKGAIEAMQLAARTGDPANKELQAWCLSRLGNEFLQTGDYEQAEQSFDQALARFPNYHLALHGKGRALAARGDLQDAVKVLNDAQNRVPNADSAILLGDVYEKIGDAEKAKEQRKLVEIIESKLGDAGDQRRLALFWADRGEKLDEALAIATREHESRKDIYTADALAWCLLKNNQLPAAKRAIAEALRLKTKDARILYHAGMIEKAAGNKAAARNFLQQSLKLHSAFDLLQADKARQALAELQ